MTREKQAAYKRKKCLLINAIIEAASYLKQMKVCPQEIMDGLIFPVESYSRPGSRKLINAIKNEDLNTVKRLIAKDRYLLYIHVFYTYQSFSATLNKLLCIGLLRGTSQKS